MTEPAADGPLPGGNVSGPIRRGDTVLRPRTPNSTYVAALLDHLAAGGWSGAPRRLAAGADGRDSYSYVDGTVPWQSPVPDWAVTDRALAALARLVRELHDRTAGTSFAGGGEVACHHDLAPANTVYRRVGGELLPVALIDWDIAGRGRRIQDVAHVCWQWLDLGPGVQDLAAAARRIGVITTAYGLADTGELLPAVLEWQDRCRRGIEAGAAAGDPAMARLVAAGVPAGIAAAHAWTREHRSQLEPPPA